MAEDLVQLTKTRGQIKAQVTRCNTFFDKFTSLDNIEQVTIRLEKLPESWNHFHEIQEKIEFLVDENVDTSAERELFENAYFSAVAKAKTLIKNRISPRPSTTENSENSNTQHVESGRKVQLPTLILPEYRGDYNEWASFQNYFKGLIDSDPSLTNFQKFHYLKSCVKDTAAEVIQSLELSDANYTIAWELLRKRFQNKRITVYNHIKLLFELTPVSRDPKFSIRYLLDNMLKHLRALETLKEPVDSWNSVIIYLMLTKLDTESRQEWEEKLDSDKLPTLSQFEKFLTKRSQILESLGVSNAQKTAGKSSAIGSFSKQNYSHKINASRVSYVTNSVPFCQICSQNSHHIYNCVTFKKLPTQAKIDEVKKHKLCLNCLRSTHYVRECVASGCKHCHKKHNTLLHVSNSHSFEGINHNKGPQVEAIGNKRVENIQNDANQAPVATSSPQVQNQTVACCATRNQPPRVLLSTAIAYVFDKYGNPHECRILLDSGSQSNFITKECSDKLELSNVNINLPVSGLSNTITTISKRTHAVIKSRFNSFQIKLSFLIIPQITENIPLEPIDVQGLKIPNNIVLADNTFHLPGKIDMLLGANIFWDLLGTERIKLAYQQPFLQKTRLGWILAGNFAQQCANKTLCHFSSNQLSDQVEKFWRLEECDNVIKYSNDEQECENNFVLTHTRDLNGRFIVNLPLKGNKEMLGDSKQNALHRLYAVERKFHKQPELRLDYVDFMSEYEKLGHMTEVQECDPSDTTTKYYLPHHAVLKQSSTTTKLRVVFDASSKTTSGVALNDILRVGPTIQQDIFSILLRFRTHRYVITADIEKMYRQIWVNKTQQDLQRIVWRSSPDQPVKTFKLATVTYGTATAPFLAVRCLHQLAHEAKIDFPLASNVIKQDFYVDDLLSGGHTIEHVISLKRDISKILESAGFKLRKWSSNEPSIFEEQSEVNANSTVIGEHSLKTLGLLWHPIKDEFHFVIKLLSDTRDVTKRIILSKVAQIFDPLGVLGPVVIKAKIILQQLWRLKSGWDDTLPPQLSAEWTNYYNHLTCLNNITIPRCVFTSNYVTIQIHAFCDASEAAYGACVYSRSTDEHGHTEIKLLCAKSRVAPLKKISLPRLELCGALLLARLCRRVIEALNAQISEVYCWSDSTITLAWIAGQPSHWKTFVANRVSEIQELTGDARWMHVRSADNPADVLSRGIEPNNLLQCKLWWNGPNWLSADSEEWPLQSSKELITEIPESQTQTLSFHVTHDVNMFERYSSLSKLKRIVAYCLRFKFNLLNTNARREGTLSVEELNAAFTTLLKRAQAHEFSREIAALTTKQVLHRSSKLLTLNPFLDDQGLIRVGGRLSQSNLTFDQRFPVILPAKHMLTNLIIRDEHYKHLHAGAHYLLASIRTRFWPLSAKGEIRKILRRCIVCFRSRPICAEQLMGDLPKIRITPARAFQNCGIDYAGPFKIKISRNKTTKAYLSLFVCLATKAVHLELVSDLSTQSFLNAFKRFISRRGKCSAVYSDNATNFVGAKNELESVVRMLSSEEHNAALARFFADESISWQLIPPQSPHHGGLWEAAVKSVKTHLYKIISNTPLTFEELYTVFTQIEACLNSRPLTPISTDPTDFTALTPGHFLIGEALTAVPQQCVLEENPHRLIRFQHLTQMVQHFWSRWSREYLTQLQHRTKWKTTQPVTLEPGTMVVLKDDHLPPFKWHLGRVIECFPGRDGLVRVVSVKTVNGVCKRPLTKLCILPLETIKADN